MPFRSDKLLHGLALVLTATVVASQGRRDAAAHVETSSRTRCTMDILPGARDSLTTTRLGRATRDTIETGGGVVAWPIRVGSHRAIYGQVVRVDSMPGPGADLARRALVARHHRGAHCSQGEQPGCGNDVWRGSALWTTPDSSGLFSLRLRPTSLWVSGRPTFDAFFAGKYSYADGPYTVEPHTIFSGPTGANLEGNASMTRAEVFALYAALSAVAHSSDSLALARLRAWVRANPRGRTRYPGNQILPGLAA